MTHRTKRLGLVLLGLALLLGACQSAPTATTAVAPEDTEPTEAVTATTAPTALPTATEIALDGCTSCHSDKGRLIDTADPEEEVISENEGEG